MTRMTDEELRALSTLEAGATKAPWTVETGEGGSGPFDRMTIRSHPPHGREYVVLSVKPFEWRGTGQAEYRESELPDLTYIVALRNAAPRLLDEVAALRAEIAKLRAVVGAAKAVRDTRVFAAMGDHYGIAAAMVKRAEEALDAALAADTEDA